MKKLIYADNAATTKLDEKAFEAMIPWLTEEFANPSQPYSFSRPAKNAIQSARKRISDCIGALPEEIFFTSGGTECDNWAIKGTTSRLSDTKTIITSAFEHHAVLNACREINDNNANIIYINPNAEGIITVELLQNRITTETKLVSIMFANNEIGTIQPIKDLCDLSHKYGAVFHTDAVQAVGHVPINVRDLGVDLLSASAHKFNGPKGVGFMYIKKGTEINRYFSGGSQEFGMRAGTENVASIVGMSVALENNCIEMAQNALYIKKIEKHLLEKLNESGIRYMRNGQGNALPGIVNLSFENYDGEAILHRLDLMGICVSTGAACDSVKKQISHVLKSMNIPASYAQGTIRISLGKNNTMDEADAIIEALMKIIR